MLGLTYSIKKVKSRTMTPDIPLDCVASCPFGKKCFELRGNCKEKIRQQVAPYGYVRVRPGETKVTVCVDGRKVATVENGVAKTKSQS